MPTTPDIVPPVRVEERPTCPDCGAPEPHCCRNEDANDDCDGSCYWCEDGWVECVDPIQCTKWHNRLGECRCSSCGGSGLAKDMTIW